MDALKKLEELYALRDATQEQIAKVEAILGTEPGQPVQRRKRGPNKPKPESTTHQT
jgi:hypothetical protein